MMARRVRRWAGKAFGNVEHPIITRPRRGIIPRAAHAEQAPPGAHGRHDRLLARPWGGRLRRQEPGAAATGWVRSTAARV